MTVIVAVRDAAGVVIGADSRVSWGWYRVAPSTLPKVIAHRSGGKGIFIGVSGYSRFMDIVRYAQIQDDLSPGRDEHQWAVTSLVPTLRSACEGAGWTRKDDSRESNSSSVVVVIGQRIMSLDSDWSVSESASPFLATGSGGVIAMGALDALHRHRPDMTAEAMALAALEAACSHDGGCAPPLTVQRCQP